MCVYVCLSMYVYLCLCFYVYIYPCMSMCVYVMRVFVCLIVAILVYACVSIYFYVCLCVSVCMYVYCISMCDHIYVNLCLHMSIYIWKALNHSSSKSTKVHIQPTGPQPRRRQIITFQPYFVCKMPKIENLDLKMIDTPPLEKNTVVKSRSLSLT